MNRRVSVAACLLLAGGSLATTVAQDSSKPLTKPQIEQIVKDYIMHHPEVLLDSVRQYQEHARAEQQQKSQDAAKSRASDLYHDAAAPATVADAKAGQEIPMVEFFDYRCGYCKRVQPTLKKVLAENPRIRLIFKEFPILGPDSTVASKAALASIKQDKYLKFHEALMTAQVPLNAANIDQIATSVGIDVPQMRKDMESPEIEAVLTRNRELAVALGVEATPSFVIGGEIVPGALDASGFQELIKKADAQQKTKRSGSTGAAESKTP